MADESRTAREPTETSVDALPDPLPADWSVLDVREQHEWDAGHAPDALHVPLMQLPERLGEVPDGPLLVVCHVGGRSARATMFLAQQGYRATNLAGGMDAWQHHGRPVVRDDGSPGQV